MAGSGPPKAMKTRLSRHNGIEVFDCVFNGVPMARCGAPNANEDALEPAQRNQGVRLRLQRSPYGPLRATKRNEDALEPAQ